MMEGLANGIYKNMDKVQRAASEVSGIINGAMNGSVRDMIGTASIERNAVIVVEGDRIILDGKEIARTTTKYISSTQKGITRSKGR